MDIVSIATAGLILAIVFFARGLLIKTVSRNIIFGVSLVLFATAVFLPIFMHDQPTLFPSLMNPLVSLGLFLIMRKLFVRWKHREPIDTFLDWRSGLAADRWFNILYFSLGVWLMFLLYLGGSNRLEMVLRHWPL
ncbi:MAG TPA: hypothetical protein VF088_01430 [Pyrinomonadaceae bacterium]